MSLKSARSALFPVRAKWRNIGIELDIDIGTLDSIEKSFHFDHTECLSRMLESWLKQTDPPPSWDAIVEALESGPIGEGHLAEQIKQKYCTTCTSHERHSGKSGDVPPPLAMAGDSQKSSSVATACTTEYVKYLKALYTSSRLPTDNKWPPTPSIHYINLALIDKKAVTRYEADEFTRYTIKGNIDDICQKKAPITIEKVACMQEIPFAYDPSQVEVSYPKLVLVTGAPGIGKSTFSWEFCRKWGNGELLQHYSLVILLRLRDKNVREANVLSDILFYQKKSISESLAIEIEQSNGEGVLFILEGFDELPEDKRVKSSLYLDLIYGRLLPLATVLVTSRPWAISDLHWKCKQRISQQFEILGFTKQQIDEYLISITLGDSNLLDELRRYVSFNPPIHAAMYIPLNAAIVFEVYRDRRDRSDCIIPNTMTELYTAFSLTLLIRYLGDQGERIGKVSRFEDLPRRIYEKFVDICKLANDGIRNKQQLIFSDLPDGFETLGFMQSLSELHISSGVSVSYNFLHLTVQEFLAAYYLSLQPNALIEGKSVTTFLAGITKLKNPAILPMQLPKYSMLVSAKSIEVEVYYDDTITGSANITSTHTKDWFLRSDTVVECHVCLSAVNLFYESQNKMQLRASIGTKTAYLEIDYKMTPMECFAAGWCIGNSNCQWKICFNENLGNVLPDCIEMFHAGIKQCYNTHLSSCYQVCELFIVDGNDYDSLTMFLDLQNSINTFSVQRFVCLQTIISSDYVSLFCTRLKKMTCLEEVVLDINCGSMEANAILDVVLASSSIGSLKLDRSLSEHFVKRHSLMNSTIHSLFLYNSPRFNIEVTDVEKCTASLINCKSLQFLTIHRYPFYIHSMLLEQIIREQNSGPCSDSDPENVLSDASLPCNSGEIIARLLQETSSLKTLNLQNCSLGQNDTTIIAQAVKHNKTLMTVDLGDNNCSRLQDVEDDPFADMLRVNHTLQVLRLCGSNVDTNSLFKVLANNENTTLRTLDVRDNDYSVKSLEDLLRNNKSLQCLQITVTAKYIIASHSGSLCSSLSIDTICSQEEIQSHFVEFKTDSTPCSKGETTFVSKFLDDDTNVIAYVDESETIDSVCSALVTALTKNTSLCELMIHTRGFFNYRLVYTLQECKYYDEVKERIKICKH